MKAIWKFPLQITNEQYIRIPSDYKIMTAQIQNGILYLWAIVESSQPHPISTRKILIFGTGQSITDEHNTYIATVQQEHLVWHVFIENES